MRYLSCANSYSRTVSGLRAYCGVTAGTASETVRRLVRRGLLERRPSDTDRRRIRLDLTSKARAMLRRDPADGLASVLSTFAQPQLTVLASVLEEAANVLAKQQGKTVFGTCRNCRYFQAAGAQVPWEQRPACALMRVALHRTELGALCMRFESR